MTFFIPFPPSDGDPPPLGPPAWGGLVILAGIVLAIIIAIAMSPL